MKSQVIESVVVNYFFFIGRTCADRLIERWFHLAFPTYSSSVVLTMWITQPLIESISHGKEEFFNSKRKPCHTSTRKDKLRGKQQKNWAIDESEVSICGECMKSYARETATLWILQNRQNIFIPQEKYF